VAEFILGNPLRNLARKHEPLRQLLWRLDFAFLWLIQRLMKSLPVDFSSRMGERLGTWIGPRLKKQHKVYRENFAIAFPQLSDTELERLTTKAWGRAGRVLAEYAHLQTILEDPQRLDITITQPIQTYEDTSVPCVIVTAHQSNWEVIGASMAKLGIPNACLYSPPTNPMLNKLLLDSRSALNCQLLPRDNSARSLMRALKEGRTAAMVMDRRVDEGKPIRFFGHDKLSTILPAKLALKMNCDLVPVEVQRKEDAHYHVTYHAPIRPSNTCSDETAQAIDMIEQVHEHFEQWITKKPEDWLCSKRLWPKGTRNKTREAGDNADIDSYAA